MRNRLCLVHIAVEMHAQFGLSMCHVKQMDIQSQLKRSRMDHQKTTTD